jgi:hypothetical protein
LSVEFLTELLKCASFLLDTGLKFGEEVVGLEVDKVIALSQSLCKSGLARADRPREHHNGLWQLAPPTQRL